MPCKTCDREVVCGFCGDAMEHMPTLKVKKLTPTAKLPVYSTEGAAAMDLHADAGTSPGERALMGHQSIIPTGIAVEVPEGYVLKIYSRSGHGFKYSVRLANCVGIIDSDYRGEIQVALHNDGKGCFSVNQGDRIAQAILEEIPKVDIVEVEELSETKRGANGFGSTGK